MAELLTYEVTYTDGSIKILSIKMTEKCFEDAYTYGKAFLQVLPKDKQNKAIRIEVTHRDTGLIWLVKSPSGCTDIFGDNPVLGPFKSKEELEERVAKLESELLSLTCVVLKMRHGQSKLKLPDFRLGDPDPDEPSGMLAQTQL